MNNSHVFVVKAVKNSICDWIYKNHSKSYIGSYEIIDFKDLKTL